MAEYYRLNTGFTVCLLSIPEVLTYLYKLSLNLTGYCECI